jgi:hypothetical protein
VKASVKAVYPGRKRENWRKGASVAASSPGVQVSPRRLNARQLLVDASMQHR